MDKDKDKDKHHANGGERVPDAIPAERFARGNIGQDLGLLSALVGEWDGNGFNLIARPDFHDGTDLYLQLNYTSDHISVAPISGNIPNRGLGQEDVNLYGLTYLQKISDASNEAAGLHVEPGLWVTLPGPIPPGVPLVFPPDTPPNGAQLVARMATIPHGNGLVIEGIAEPFTGVPAIKTDTQVYKGSRFPSFNSTPVAAPPTVQSLVINAATSSEKQTATNLGGPALPPFPMYDLKVPIGPLAVGTAYDGIVFNAGGPNRTQSLNTRTPFSSTFPAVTDQALVDDPILLIQQHNQKLQDEGYQFDGGTVINIATQRTVLFEPLPNQPGGGPPTVVSVPNFGGSEPLAVANHSLSLDTTFGANQPPPLNPPQNPAYEGEPTIPNIQFLMGQFVNLSPPGPPGQPPPPAAPKPVANAQTALVYATFWISKVTPPKKHHQGPKHHHQEHFMLLQYAQMVVLNFPILHVLFPDPAQKRTVAASRFVNLGWPHVTVGSLKKRGV